MRWRGLTAWGIVLLGIGLVLFGTWLVLINVGRPQTTVTIGGTAIKADLATTPAQQTQGLSDVTVLPEGSGMLFVYAADGTQPMATKDLRVSVDIIWLNADKRVVAVTRDVTPGNSPRTYESDRPARYVLEVPAGTVESAGITDGTQASFSLNQ